MCRLKTQEEPLFPFESGGRERPHLSGKAIREGEFLTLGEGQPVFYSGLGLSRPGSLLWEGDLLSSVCRFNSATLTLDMNHHTCLHPLLESYSE